MASLTEIETVLNRELDRDSFTDYAPNGVQVRGREQVQRIVTGVSACVALFEAAVDQKADLILVHHGLFWDKESRVVAGSMKRRLQILLQQDITLMAYHLPLDAHPQYGNNIQIIKKLALTPVAPFGFYRGRPLSFMATTAGQQEFSGFVERLQQLFGTSITLFPFGPSTIQRIAVCSGGAPELASEAVAQRADLFLTGEVSEPLFHYAQEEGLNVIGAGHHQTERWGVQAVGAFIAERFGVTHQFIDIKNPV
ncbi:MAG: Nif3-like dinuclear metal center hexameric protein [Magnetococcales bacterium]|nr:Nif3-like dinuclear metal center hexameric protein [Magnetococcales bacterium]